MTAGAASSGVSGVPASAGRPGNPSAEEVAAVIAVLFTRRRRPWPRRVPARPAWRLPSYAGSRSWARPRGGWGSAA
jgi:hypothetical protein